MFPTFYMPAVASDLENRIALDFFAISSGPDLGGVTDPNSATVFFGYEVNVSTDIVGYPVGWSGLSSYATKREIRFGVGANLRFYSLIWDKADTFIAVGYNSTVNPIIYKSTDKGNTWSDVTATFISAGMVQLTLAANGVGYASYRTQINSYIPQPGAFLLAVPSGALASGLTVLRSTNATTWSDVSAAFLAYYPSGLTTNPYTTWVDGNTFYVGYNYNEYISTTDGGISWSAVALPSTILSSSAGVLYKYNDKWQARNVFNTGLAETTTLTSNPANWTTKSFGLGSTLYYGLGYSKLPNQNEGLWQAVNTFGSNEGYRIENSKYIINSALDEWVFWNTFGTPEIRAVFQPKKPNAVKFMFIPYASASTNTTTKSYRFSLWMVSGSPGSLAISADTLNSTAQWTTGGFTGFALDPENITFNGAVTGSFLGK